jgi:hypothetical protein
MPKERRDQILHGRISVSEMQLLKQLQVRRQKVSKRKISQIDVIVDALKFSDGQITDL